MRFSVVLSVLLFGFAAILLFQYQHALAQPGGQQGAGQRQPGMGGGRGGQAARQGQPPATGQGTRPAQPAQPAQPAAPGVRPARPTQPPAVQRQPQPTIPVARPFGEPSPSASPVTGFGQPVTAPQGSPGARNANTANTARQQRDAQAAQQAAVQAARNANAIKQTGPYDHIPPAVRNNATFSWFFEYDKDQDAQLSMMEYVNGRGGVWTEDIAREFSFLDRNGDGFVTVEEALTSIKEDDEKKAREAREQQAAAGPQGRPQPGQQPTAGRRGSQAGGQGGRSTGAGQVRQPASGRGQGEQQNLGPPSGRGRSRGGSQ